MHKHRENGKAMMMKIIIVIVMIAVANLDAKLCSMKSGLLVPMGILD
jgi:hypothetical protein